MNVQVLRRAQKELSKLHPKRRVQILRALARLEEQTVPDDSTSKRIEGTPWEALYRLRVGDYRVLYTIAGDTVSILRVVTRQDLSKAIRQLSGG